VINGRTDRERKRKFSAYNIDEVNTIPHVNDKLWTHVTCEIWSAHSGGDDGYCRTRCDAAKEGKHVLK